MASSNESILEFLAAVLSVPGDVPDVMQDEIADAAAAAKSKIGDKALVALARLPRVSDHTRGVLERTGRAAAKAAWLSRPDHSREYVEKSIKAEKRVTVLAAVAANTGASDELVIALSRSDSLRVAQAVFGRESKPDQSLENAVVVLLGSSGTSYATWYQVKQVLDSNRDLAERVAGRLTSLDSMIRAMSEGLPISASDYPRYVKTIMASWQRELPEPNPNQRWWSMPESANRYSASLSRLLTHPCWDEEAYGLELAPLAERLMAYRDLANGRAGSRVTRNTTLAEFSDPIGELWIRYYGTDQQRVDLEQGSAARRQELDSARLSDDPAVIRRHLASSVSDTAVLEALCANPNLTLEDLASTRVDQRSSSLVRAAAARPGADPIQAATLSMACEYGYYGHTSSAVLQGLSEEERVEVGRQFIAYTRQHSGTELRFYDISQVFACQDSSVADGAISRLTMAELIGVLSYDYLADEYRAMVLRHAREKLADGLQDRSAWQTFFAVGSESTAPLEDALNIASML